MIIEGKNHGLRPFPKVYMQSTISAPIFNEGVVAGKTSRLVFIGGVKEMDLDNFYKCNLLIFVKPNLFK
jgi:hypothetical protein